MIPYHQQYCAVAFPLYVLYAAFLAFDPPCMLCRPDYAGFSMTQIRHRDATHATSRQRDDYGYPYP